MLYPPGLWVNMPLGRNLLAVHCLERACVCPVTAPCLGDDSAPVCVVSSRWMSPVGVEVSAREF